jgi:hypothetical protein
MIKAQLITKKILERKIFWTLLEPRGAIRREDYQTWGKHVYAHKNW